MSKCIGGIVHDAVGSLATHRPGKTYDSLFEEKTAQLESLQAGIAASVMPKTPPMLALGIATILIFDVFPSIMLLNIFPVNQIHYHFHHNVLLFRPTLGYHQRQGYEGVVRNAFRAIFTIKNSVVVEEP